MSPLRNLLDGLPNEPWSTAEHRRLYEMTVTIQEDGKKAVLDFDEPILRELCAVFVDNRQDLFSRRWVAVVVIHILLTSDQIEQAFTGFPEKLARKVGDLIFLPVADELKFLAASIVRLVLEKEVPISLFSSKANAEKMSTAFSSFEEDSQWVETLDDILDALPNEALCDDYKIYSPQDVSVDDGVSITANGEGCDNILVEVGRGYISIMTLPAERRTYFMDIPFSSVTAASFSRLGRTSRASVPRVQITLELQEKTWTILQNAQRLSAKNIAMQFSNEEEAKLCLDFIKAQCTPKLPTVQAAIQGAASQTPEAAQPVTTNPPKKTRTITSSVDLLPSPTRTRADSTIRDAQTKSASKKPPTKSALKKPTPSAKQDKLRNSMYAGDDEGLAKPKPKTAASPSKAPSAKTAKTVKKAVKDVDVEDDTSQRITRSSKRNKAPQMSEEEEEVAKPIAKATQPKLKSSRLSKAVEIIEVVNEVMDVEESDIQASTKPSKRNQAYEASLNRAPDITDAADEAVHIKKSESQSQAKPSKRNKGSDGPEAEEEATSVAVNIFQPDPRASMFNTLPEVAEAADEIARVKKRESQAQANVSKRNQASEARLSVALEIPEVTEKLVRVKESESQAQAKSAKRNETTKVSEVAEENMDLEQEIIQHAKKASPRKKMVEAQIVQEEVIILEEENEVTDRAEIADTSRAAVLTESAPKVASTTNHEAVLESSPSSRADDPAIDNTEPLVRAIDFSSLKRKADAPLEMRKPSSANATTAKITGVGDSLHAKSHSVDAVTLPTRTLIPTPVTGSAPAKDVSEKDISVAKVGTKSFMAEMNDRLRAARVNIVDATTEVAVEAATEVAEDRTVVHKLQWEKKAMPKRTPVGSDDDIEVSAVTFGAKLDKRLEDANRSLRPIEDTVTWNEDEETMLVDEEDEPSIVLDKAKLVAVYDDDEDSASDVQQDSEVEAVEEDEEEDVMDWTSTLEAHQAKFQSSIAAITDGMTKSLFNTEATLHSTIKDYEIKAQELVKMMQDSHLDEHEKHMKTLSQNKHKYVKELRSILDTLDADRAAFTATCANIRAEQAGWAKNRKVVYDNLGAFEQRCARPGEEDDDEVVEVD